MISNKNEFRVDFRAFKKTKEEKAHTQTMKARWKKNMILFYGKDWRKYNNYPFTLSNV